MEVRDGGRWCLEDSLPMMLESERWLAAASSRRLREALPWAVMERARVCDGLCATVAPWAWARVGWVAVWEFEMSCAVGSFALAFERVCALFLRPTERGRATEGEVGETALLLLSLDCELPILRGGPSPSLSPFTVHQLFAPARSAAAFTFTPVSLGRATRSASWLSSSRLEAAHALAANGTRGNGSRQRRITGEGNVVGTTVVQTACLQYRRVGTGSSTLLR